MADGFLSRWSRRKEAVREGKPVEEEPAQAAAPVVPAAAAPHAEAAPQTTPSEPPPTMEDVQVLTPKDDFSRFVAPEVPAEVKNAALKKLFTDPHFNAMDGLDVYIDDYGKPDPIPASMLRKLAASRFLKLFDDEEEKEKQGREVEHDPKGESVAQSGTGAPAVPAPEDHAHADLRLQQDDAPGPPGPGEGDR